MTEQEWIAKLVKRVEEVEGKRVLKWKIKEDTEKYIELYMENGKSLEYKYGW